MIPVFDDAELVTALGRTPTHRERHSGAETIWFGSERVLLAELTVPGADARAVYEGLREAAARTGHLRTVLEQPPVRAMVVPAALPGAQQAVAADHTCVVTIVLPRGFSDSAAEAAARLLAEKLVAMTGPTEHTE